MKTLDEIKQMMAAGDAAKSAESLKELLAKEPDNLQAKMLYGTCCQLLGDEETFRRIHDELAPVMEKRSMGTRSAEAKMWESYKRFHVDMSRGALCSRCLMQEDGAVSMEYLILALIILAAVGACVICFERQVSSQSLYRGPAIVGKDLVVQTSSDARVFSSATITNSPLDVK